MVFDPRVVVAVRDGALADIETHQVQAFAQSLVETGNLHLCPLGQRQRVGQRNPRGVHHAVAFETVMRTLNEAVSPGTDDTLSIDDHAGDAFETVFHIGSIAGGDDVLGQQDVDVGVLPGAHAALLIVFREQPHLFFDDGQVLPVTAGEESEGVEGAGDLVACAGVGLHLFCQRFATLLEDLLGFGTVVGSRLAVTAKNLKLDGDVQSFTITPDSQRQAAPLAFRFRQSDGLPHPHTRIVADVFTEEPGDDITHLQLSIRRRSRRHFGHENLPRIGGHMFVAVDPSAGPGWTQVPVGGPPFGHGTPRGQIRTRSGVGVLGLEGAEV